ncbi:dienelactone hydrolase family protein [Konateibacter massiliensis]|uniref:dienelactone hydrolase family protein n=1 Tax=Konateibacter massiliensis TaxID=2002841 RepID=UPI000C155972|nr:alpha/beta hydrolase family protein [Konateibacter massiliensis]
MEGTGNTIKIEQYYTSIEHLKKKFDEGRKSKFTGKTQEEFESWKANTRELLKKLIGLDKMESCDLEARTVEIIQPEEGITREKVIIQVEPGVYMPIFILIPDEKNEDQISYCLALPGHTGAGKYSIAGCAEIPAVAERIEQFDYDYGLRLARLGYVTLCPDIRGFGERREEALQSDDDMSFVSGSCFHLAHMAEPLGQTVIGMNVWDMMCLLNYIETRGEWKSDKVGCVGFSGGGLLTLWLSALDDRIGKSLISGYLYGYKDSLLELNGNCSCNYVPHLWEYVDMGDIAAMLAPRPVIIQSCKEDHLNGKRGLENVREQLEIMKQAYCVLNKEGQMIHDVREGGHSFHHAVLEGFTKLDSSRT